jgi:hypothetical protein
MKRLINLIFAMTLLLAMASCEKDLPLYSDSTCRLNFYYGLDSRADFDSALAVSSFSFVYGGSDVARDTMWFKVQTMGFVSDQDRPISLVQVDTTANKAVAGKHFVAFDDPSIAEYYKIPAGKAMTSIPVILLRDASLKDTSVVLKFRFKDNEYFTKGYDEYQTRVIVFTDRMAEPAKWNYPYPYYGTYTIRLASFFGTYGVVKHQFLIDHTGKKWDDDFIEQLMTGDSNYLQYLAQKMRADLVTLNAERAAKGLGDLSEADGTPVSFDK